MIPAFLLAFAGKVGIPAPLRKAAVIGTIVVLIVALLAVGKCTYDRSVIRQHEQKAALEQARRERKADANLQSQKARDDAAAEQRREEIDNATRNIADQVPSARQRARACLELRRQAEQRGKPVPAC